MLSLAGAVPAGTRIVAVDHTIAAVEDSISATTGEFISTAGVVAVDPIVIPVLTAVLAGVADPTRVVSNIQVRYIPLGVGSWDGENQ